jgi:dihydropyrimidinase
VQSGLRSIKIFMANASTRLTDAQVLETLAAARQLGALVCVHAENHELIEWLTKRLLAKGMTAPRFLAMAKPMIAEREATHRVIAMAEALDAPIQVFHISGRDSAEEVARAQRRGVKVWAETCSQYLVLTANHLDRPGFEGAKFAFAPAARTEADQQELWRRIQDGTITVVSSDHSPLKFDDPRGKMLGGPNASFDKIPNGVPGLASRRAASTCKPSSAWSRRCPPSSLAFIREREPSRSAATRTWRCGIRASSAPSPTR